MPVIELPAMLTAYICDLGVVDMFAFADSQESGYDFEEQWLHHHIPFLRNIYRYIHPDSFHLQSNYYNINLQSP